MSIRQEKVTEQLRHHIAFFLERESSPLSLISVTRITVSPDLKKATVYISVLPESKEQAALHFVERQLGGVRQYLKGKLETRVIPHLDVTLDYGEKNRQQIDAISREDKKSSL
ncbi:ribosome-binding factor A [Candidatus Nomurabacteria bacterium]|jgi:ribosome-binding factor A|nr:ribosome-binding factor A [Candidatus Nomurabacteria bacterium]